MVGKNEIYNRENLVRPFLEHQVLGPKPPPPLPPPCSKEALPPPPLPLHAVARPQPPVSIQSGQKKARKQVTIMHSSTKGSESPSPSSAQPVWTQKQRKEALKAFFEEMRTISSLRHPNITTIMGAIMEPGEDPLMVMECMDRGMPSACAVPGNPRGQALQSHTTSYIHAHSCRSQPRKNRSE